MERNRRIKMHYNTEEKLAQVENEAGEKYLFERDAVGSVIRETGYDGVRKLYEYSPAGKLTGMKRGDTADWVNMNYDAGGYLSKITYPNSEEELFTYGKMGELLGAENKNVKLTFVYDKMGNLLKETLNGHHVENQYAADSGAGYRIGLQTSFGLQVDINRNKYGQAEEMTANFENTAVWKSTMTYNVLGQVTERTSNGIIKDVWNYDPQGRPVMQSVSINKRESSHRKYFWDTGDKLKSIIDNIGNMGLTYSYDRFGNPETETYEGGNVQADRKRVIRHLDDSGRVHETLGLSGRKYGKGGQLLSLNRQKYQYNDCGDMVEKREADGKVWQYFYHPGGLLEKVTRPDGKEVNFTYDPLGRRVSKEFGGGTRKYLWDGDQIIHEWVEEGEKKTDEQSKASRVFSWLYEDGTFTPLAKLTEEKAYSVISDHLGTPNTLLDQSGKVVWKANLDIYGKARMQEGGKTEEENCLFRFPGQYEDEETGLYYNRFRYYMPGEGVYTQRDPIGLAGGNPTIYGYVSNPNIWTDPFGLIALDELGYSVYGLFKPGADTPYYVGITNDYSKKNW